MKFNVGDRIEIVRPFLRLGRNHVGAIGEIVDLVRFPFNAPSPTHYVVKFECYKIPHYFMPCEIDESCEILNRKI